jgi:CoA-dependent NAD(P)H sulfur oxidoreductase
VIYKPAPKNIIVVGGNAAGPAAAAKAKRTDPSANVLMFECGDFISTGTCELPYVLGGVISDYEKIVFFTPEKFEAEKGVKVYTNHMVESINRIKKIISVKNLKSSHSIDFCYDKLILATGSAAKRIDALPNNLKNVFTLKSVSDLISIRKYLSSVKQKKALVIGSGYIGLEVAEVLGQIGMEVILVEKDKLPLPGSDIEIQNLLLTILQQNKVDFYGGVVSPKFRFNDDAVKSIEIDGWQREVDFVIQAIGFEPNTSLAVASKLDLGKVGIKVDQRLRTSDANILAAGDCIEIINQVSGRPFYLPLATVARDFGHIAGENAAGGNAFAPPIVPNIAVKIFDGVFVSAGFNSREALDNNYTIGSVSATASSLVKVMHGARNTFGKIIFEKGNKRILGAQFLGGSEVIGYGDLLSAYIRNKNKLNDLAIINYNYTPPQSPFVNLLSILGRKS